MNAEQIAALWVLLSQTWGTKFIDQYGKKPNEAWTMALTGMPIEAARFALKELIREGSAFPPTLPEFIAQARRYRPPVIPDRLLGHDQYTDEQRQANLARLKAAVRDICAP